MYKHLGWHFPDFDRHFSRTVSQYPATDYQQSTIDEAVRHVKAFDCAVDVGGNIGLHTVRFARLFAQVHSFEPTDINFECLQKNTESIPNIQLHKLGLGDKPGTLIIQLPIDADNCGNFSIVDFVDNDKQTVKETIEIRTLDSFEIKPDLIKIDVQGFDYNVLVGATTTIAMYHPVIIIESETKQSRNSISEFLQLQGYSVVAKIRHDQIWVYQEKA
jgi:FkbM family methyltransferase